ncbi:MAG: adenine deaminase, partial [Candidatus Marinimicrobia bacterium]|nr:adenine deaminase [Candidatus Neomarinimicrobiota bacterium]
EADSQIILPGLVDAHIHIESSMLVPTEFARLAVTHGTVAAVCDPHEIANVLGIAGVEFMLENAGQSPFKFYFGAPSCVPATPFETAGAAIELADIEKLFSDGLKFLSEMMNVPGVLRDLPEVQAKLELAQKYGRPVDGHSPGLRGADVEKYIAAGISTDHECVTLAEAREKIANGMKIQIREGSAARNFEDLYPLIDEFPALCMLCSDDKHPDDLEAGHINELIKRGLANGLDKYNLLRASCITPVEHYGLDVGLLRVGDPADFIVVDNLQKINVLKTYISGNLVAENDRSALPSVPVPVVNNFNCQSKKVSDFVVPVAGERIRIIDVIPDQLITNSALVKPRIIDDNVVADPGRDILKLTVVNRYVNAQPAIGFVRNFGLKSGAIASSVAHDSHNIVAIGASDAELCRVVNRVIEQRGGIAAVNGQEELILALPVAGIMSDRDGHSVATLYSELDQFAKGLGSTLPAPFMSLSFLALLVIPELKLSDQGLFDGVRFKFTSVFG